MLRFSVLGSGSGGNSAVLCSGQTKILIDAGLSARQLVLRLEACGIDADDLDAVLLTHEHGDHTTGLDVFCRKRCLPVYATTHTCELVREKMRSEVKWKKFEAGTGFRVGDIDVESFSVPHDAVDPVGFVMRAAGVGFGLLSDVGHVTAMARDHLRDLDTLFVEANYDEKMLQNDIRRPWATKQRISSRHGHLSNDQTADLLATVASDRLCRVVLGHLSSDCNCPIHAAKFVGDRLRAEGFKEVEVECARQREPLPMRPVARKPAAAVALSVSAPSAVYSENARPETGSRIAEEAADSGRRTDYAQSEWGF